MEPDTAALLTVTNTSSGGTATILVAGEVDMDTCGQLDQALDRALDDSERIDLDLSGVRFMDSTGLACLLRLRALAAKRGRTFRIVAMSVPVDRLLEVSGVHGAMT